MVALKLQQFQYNLKKIFFGALYFLCLFVKVRGGGGCRGGGDYKGGGGAFQRQPPVLEAAQPVQHHLLLTFSSAFAFRTVISPPGMGSMT